MLLGQKTLGDIVLQDISWQQFYTQFRTYYKEFDKMKEFYYTFLKFILMRFKNEILII